MNWDEKGEKEEKKNELGWERRKGRKKKKEITNWKRRKKSEKKKGKKKIGEWSQKLRLVSPSLCVYLQKCHHNSVSIPWKHLKCVFNFHNSSLKNQIIEWWKQKLKTSPNKPFSHGTHIFWVMGDGNTKTKQPLRN